MATTVPSFKDYISGKQDTSTKDNKASSVASFANFLKENPEKPKKEGIVKTIAKAVVEPVATIVARPIQLAAEGLGASPEAIDKFSKKNLGGFVAPLPQNTSDVIKDVGRGVQTVLTGGLGNVVKGGVTAIAEKAGAGALGKVAAVGAAEGAGYGAGAALEQGGSETSFKDFLKQSAIGAGIGAVAPVVIGGVSKALKGKPKVPPVEPSITNAVEDVVPSIENKIAETPTAKKTKPLGKVSEATPEYKADIERRSAILDKDPEFQGSSNQSKVVKYDTTKSLHTTDEMIDFATGKNPNTPEGLPATAIQNLLKEEVVTAPEKFTPEQIKRLANNNVRSQAGADLQATQVQKGAIIDNPVDFITAETKKLKDNASSKGITKNTIKKFLDDIEC